MTLARWVDAPGFARATRVRISRRICRCEMNEAASRDAMHRIAWLFRVPAETLSTGRRFGIDLKASTRSDWSENELDEILVDIQEMQAGIGKTKVEIETVFTVGEFCALAEQYHRVSPDGYRLLRERWQKEATMSQRPLWRRVVYRLVRL